MKTLEVVQLKSGTTTGTQLKFGSSKTCFIWLCDSWPHTTLIVYEKDIKT